jgi:hypothetical protein
MNEIEQKSRDHQGLEHEVATSIRCLDYGSVELTTTPPSAFVVWCFHTEIKPDYSDICLNKVGNTNCM